MILIDKQVKSRTVVRFSASAAPKMNCLLRIKRTILDGYQELLPYNDVLYGSAVHKFISTMHESGGNFVLATQEAKRIFSKPCEIRKGKKHLTEVHMLKTCLDYWEHYTKHDDFELLTKEDGKPAVEFSFDNQIYIDDEVEILFQGVMDKIGRFKGGCAAVGDYKITSAWSQEDYFEQYRLSTQLRFYLFNLKLAARSNPNSPIAKLCNVPLGYFVDGIFISKDGATFKRSEVIVPTEQDDKEFANSLAVKVIPSLVNLAKNPQYSMRDGMVSGACCELKYPCEYLNVCAAPDDIARQHLLRSSFTQREYLPLTHSKD